MYSLYFYCNIVIFVPRALSNINQRTKIVLLRQKFDQNGNLKKSTNRSKITKKKNLTTLVAATTATITVGTTTADAPILAVVAEEK